MTRVSNQFSLEVCACGIEENFKEGEEATKSPLTGVSLALNDEGELLVVSRDYSGAYFVLKIGIDGRIRKVAGNGVNGFAGDGGPALDASLGDDYGSEISIALGKDGEGYIADTYNYRIRMVNSEGVISTIAGDGNSMYAGDGGPATEASFTSPLGLSVAPNGDLYHGFPNMIIKNMNLRTLGALFNQPQ